MAPDQYKWDLFISYARENQDFVRKELIEPLRGYRTADGRAVKAFVDTLSLRAGVDWMVKVTEAILESRVLIAVYSAPFFDSENCMYELAGGAQRDPLGARGMFCPVAIDPIAVSGQVPAAYARFNWVDATEDGWFHRLVDTLGYRHHGRIHILEFGAEIAPATAGVPLPPVRVEMQHEGRRVDESEDIRILSEGGTLRGTTTVKSHNGLAVFQDLFFDAPLENTRLVATADGCAASFTNSFSVLPAPIIETPKGDPRIDASGEVCFFGEPEVIGVAASGVLHIFSLVGDRLGRPGIPGLVRFMRPCAGGLVVCGWDGEIVWISPRGERRRWRPFHKNGLSIPGDVTGASGDELYAGMWSGEVWRLPPDGEAVLLFRHPGGVQALGVLGSEVFVADLDGNLAVYSGQQRTVSVHTEPTIHRLKVFEQSAVLIGEEELYVYSIDKKKIFAVRLPISERIAAVYGIGERAIAVSRQGRGILFNREDTSQNFWTAIGCVPVSMDEDARFCVFRNPDHSYSLWHNRRPLLQGVTGGLAVSRLGTHFAIGEGRGLKISLAESILGSAPGGDVAQA